MSLDFLAIADGLAARYAPAAVTPPTGYTNITLSTARLPNGLATLPAVLVFPEGGDATYNAQREGQHQFRVRFLLDQSSGDLRKNMVSLLKWLGVLWDQTHAAVKLGLSSTVMKALPASYELGVFDYGGEKYDGIDVLVTVWTSDTVTLTP